ncbi:hypothetical protein [Candidatus Oleimmundimicrobium sp.]|uniref:hypothetical protein n=1 Tax=Candidatus Oleimmundimicrobium sp. TaxID=3060597 RepID=UPI002728FC13|nr:hypothetical protein [Candidatus Oleimmundimicrobium sp.]MDO8885487.1 hypothetical protein [Candidatus Oleimmundimicrobium sp.]
MEWDTLALKRLHSIKAKALSIVPEKLKKTAKSKMSETETQVREQAELLAGKAGKEKVVEEDLIEALKWMVPFDKRPYLIKILLMANVDVSKYFDKYDLYDLDK